MTLRVYLAGNVALEDGDALVPEKRFPGRQARLAFAVLGWHRDRALSTDELAEIVWDGDRPDAWATALRALISKLRSVLGRHASIEHAFGCYQLRLPADAWVDVEAAGEAVHDAEAAFRDGDLEHGMGSALVANAIARRPFLAGDDGGWIAARREELVRIRVRALDVRSRVSLSNGDVIGAVRDAEIVVELEPYRESAYATLMRAHVGAGNAPEALAVYERLRVRLADDLGTSPSPQTEALFLEVLAARA